MEFIKQSLYPSIHGIHGKLRGSSSITELHHNWSCDGKEERLPGILKQSKLGYTVCTIGSPRDSCVLEPDCCCSEVVVGEVREMVASGKRVFAFQDVVL